MSQANASQPTEVEIPIREALLSKCLDSGVCYITDDTGKRVAVLLDIEEYDRLQEQLEFLREQDTQHSSQADADAGTRIGEAIDAIMAEVPEEELDRLPRDGASHHDQYLYGKS